MKRMENRSVEGDRPVIENPRTPRDFLSNTMHVKLRMKLCRPRHKAKYFLVTDSEQVPRGKGEKHPDEGSEIDLKPDAYKQSERDVVSSDAAGL